MLPATLASPPPVTPIPHRAVPATAFETAVRAQAVRAELAMQRTVLAMQRDNAGNVRIRPPGTEEPSGDVQRVVVQASARLVRVIADHAVDTITAEGPHTVQRDGDVLRVDAGSPVSSAAGGPPGSYRFERRNSGFSRWLSQATQLGVPLIVRVNPRLRVDMEVMAGSLEVMGLRAPFSFSVTAGSLRASDCAGPFTGSVRAGSARLEVRPEAGVSSVRVESGSVDVRLLPGSSVRIRARAELGEVKIKGPDGSTRSDGAGAQELVIGAGAAVLEVDAVMGSVKVRTP